VTFPAKSVSTSTRQLITTRRMAKQRREHSQQELLDPRDLYHETILSKLWPLNHTTQISNFARCGAEEIFRTCKNCGHVESFYYRCSIKWCPRCQWWLATKRQNIIAAWAAKIQQPKHLVTTQSNFDILTHRTIRQHQRNLARFRRTKCFEKVRGGCVSTEITNESRGWHLHAHWLLDVDWLDMSAVSVTWGKEVGQKFAIVKVKDVRGSNYVGEVAKYLAKGSEIASWDADQINEFTRAIYRCRFFASFGALREMAPEIRRTLALSKPQPMICKCGCGQFHFGTDKSEISHAARV
jgi:predicted Rdx family selenoprotein